MVEKVGFLDEAVLIMVRAGLVPSRSNSFDPIVLVEESADSRHALLNQIYVDPLVAGDLVIQGIRILKLSRSLSQSDPGFAYEVISQEGRGPIFFEAMLRGIFGDLALGERLERLELLHSLIQRK